MIINNQSITSLIVPTLTGEEVTVIIQLVGGNDGINTVIPTDQYNKYYNARKNIAIPEGEIIKIDDSLGLHPSMTKMRNLYVEGKLAIVQNVGMPNPNASHFRATDIWMSASDSDIVENSGWQGRTIESFLTKVPDHPPAIQVGSVSALLFQGITSPVGITIGNPNDFYDFVNGIEDTPPNTLIGKELDYIKNLVKSTEKYSEVIKNAYNSAPSSTTVYENTSISSQLKIVAKLIAGGLKSKVYLVSQEGYDTHAQQSDTHRKLLTDLSDAISSFMTDINYYGKDNHVTCMTFSEFGRRIASNDSLGTDHGDAAPLFVIGKNVKGGIYGNNPIIPENVQVSDNIPYQLDFREVYSTILQDWQALTPQKSEEILFKPFNKIDFMATSTTIPETPVDIYNMELHEIFFDESTGDPLVMRVPGGWIYYLKTAVFVPYNEEFKKIQS